MTRRAEITIFSYVVARCTMDEIDLVRCTAYEINLDLCFPLVAAMVPQWRATPGDPVCRAPRRGRDQSRIVRRGVGY